MREGKEGPEGKVEEQRRARKSQYCSWTRSQSSTESSTDQARRLTNRFGLSQDEQKWVLVGRERDGASCAQQRAGATAGEEREGAIQLVNRQASHHAD